MNKQHLILHLSLIKGVSVQTVNRLIKVIKQDKDVHRWYTFKKDQFVRLGTSEVTAQKIVDGLADTEVLHTELELIEKHAIEWATPLDETYPALLQHIHIPPAVLYWKGAPLWIDHKMIGFVGARKGNAYGKRAINALIPGLVKHGYVIASGGAYGIDTMAHQATVDCSGKTVVVLGAGLLQPVLYGNQRLFKKIIDQGGALVSGFSLQEPASTWTFPIRNRIIAGLSEGCVVVQAAQKSGALITATHALQEGRQVFAVPGPFDDELSQGCNTLLQEGAKLVQNVKDILEEFGIEPSDQCEQQVIVQKEYSEDPLLKHCVESISLMDLSEKTGIIAADLEKRLFELQLAGKVQQDFVGFWVKQ